MAHLNDDITSVTGLQTEVCNLWAQSSLHLFVHLMTRLHQLHSQIHVVHWEAVVSSQSQGPW